MPPAPFGKWFGSRTANWKFGQPNRSARNNRAARMFSFCVFMVTRIALIVGQQQRLRCGMIAQLKSGE